MRSLKPLYKVFFLCAFSTLIQLFSIVRLTAQHYNFKSYSVEEGLSQSQVYAICQDKKGNLWIGTVAGGVSKYDGSKFTNYTKKEGLADNTVTSIIQDRKGNMWFATYAGVTMFDGFKMQTFTTKNGLCSDRIYKIFEDRDGKLWFGSDMAGVCIYDGKTFKTIDKRDGLSNNTVWAIMQENSGDMWLGTDQGLNRYDGKKFEVYTKEDGMAGDAVYSLFQDRQQHIWVGTSQGLSRFNESRFINYTLKDGLVGNSVWSIIEDGSGRLWISTSSGVSQFNGYNFINYTIDQGLSNNSIWCGYLDREGDLWFGTNGGGIVKYSRRCFVSYSKQDGLSDDIVISIYQDKAGTYWFGTYSGGVTKYDGKSYKAFSESEGLINKRVWASFQDKNGFMWFATQKGVSRFDGKSFKSFSEKDGLPRDVVHSIYQDSKDNIWFATYKGIGVFDGVSFHTLSRKEGLPDEEVRSMYADRNGKLWFTTKSGAMMLEGYEPGFVNPKFLRITENEGLISNDVMCIAQDKYGSMWLGTNQGITQFVKIKGRFVPRDTITVSDGLLDDAVTILKVDNKNNLWIGASKGISKLDLLEYQKTNQKKFKHFNKSDGFSGVECNQNAVFEDLKGQIWFGTIKGAIRYNALDDKLNKTPPSTHITGIRLNFEDADLLTYSDSISKATFLPVNLELPYKKNHITFDFIGVSLAVPEKVRYQYLLEGLDNNWSPITEAKYVTYPSLAPGDYTFKVRACNNDGIWNEKPVTFSFQITPPFWLRTWFIVLCIAMIVGSVYIGVRLRLRGLVRQRQLLEEKVALRTKELKEEKEKVEQINQEVVEQKEIIELKNKDITDSIHYAKRIQEAILPSKALISKSLPDSFVIFRPKDIVSGDFYWFGTNKDKVLIAAVDCTGHGVPGAFMSMIGNTLLNEIVMEKGIVNPAEVLNNLHEGVRTSLKQNLEDAETNDGMDVALCAIDLNTNEVEYAAAYRPLYHFSGGVINEIKGDKFAIGGSHIEEKRIFKNNLIKVSKGDSIYLFTDGYVDQFGGKDGKKFLSKRFQELLLSVNALKMSEQEMVINKNMVEWRGKEEQVDDVLVIGIKF